MSSNPAAELVLLAQEFLNISGLTYPFLLNAVANITLVVWDILLTFEEEVFFLIYMRTSFVKSLFFVVRYLALFLPLGSIFFLFGNQHVEIDLCPAFIWYLTVIGMIIIACSNLLLIHRVVAFYERDRNIMWFLSIVFAITETAVVIFIALAIPKFHLTKNPFPPPFPMIVGDCVSGPYPNTMAFMWLSELVFQTIAFCCIIARFIYMRNVANKDGVPASPLYTLFLRDGIWVYVLLFATFSLNVIYTWNPTYNGLTTGLWSFTATSICCSRLILNIHSSVFRIKECFYEPQPYFESTSDLTVQDFTHC